MKPGARSIRGAMGTYAWVAALALVLTGLALWLGPGLRPQRAEVRLAPGAGLGGALLERDGQQVELLPGEPLQLSPGTWRLRLFGADGALTEEREVELSAEAPTELP